MSLDFLEDLPLEGIVGYIPHVVFGSIVFAVVAATAIAIGLVQKRIRENRQWQLQAERYGIRSRSDREGESNG